MNNASFEQFTLLAWTPDGKMHINTAFPKPTISVTGDGSDADFQISELENNRVFLRQSKDQATILFQSGSGLENISKTLQVGLPIKVGPLTWMISFVEDQTCLLEAAPAGGDNESKFVESLFNWLGRPMLGPKEFNLSLEELLKISIDKTSAANGLLVLCENSEFRLAATHRLSKAEAKVIWSKMPPQLSQEILEHKASLILPDGLRKSKPGQTTIFVKNFRSVAGFPVIAEGHLLGILYLGFDNILTDLSESLQFCLESTCKLMGIVIQRALFRQELKLSKLSGDDQNYQLPANRLMMGQSTALTVVYKMLARLAPVQVPTLIQGETGTGKELTARELHTMSDRSDKPFITINAAAFPENLLEAELFGYKKGSFTGATSDHMGFIEQANTGTLFIDEVGELSLNVQTKLLRVLQEKSVHRIGETKARDIEFRLVAATNKDLAAMVEAGSFREDLYYRIAGAVVSLPPLRQRREDILLLANYFKKEFSIKHHIPEKNWGSDAIEALEAHSWPGNIRELGNTVHRSIVMTEKNIICREDLGLVASPGKIKTANQFQIGLPKYDDLASAKRDFMRTFLLGSLNKFSGNRVKTAKALGIGQRTLFRYLEQYEIRD